MASERIEIIKELRALEQFCTFKSVRSGEEQERFLKDYLADIQEYPLEAIQRACAAWRKSGATKFPTSGQLIPLIRQHVSEDRGPRLQPWRELSDDEYAALPLRDKIRHHEILAHDAARKAGPQWLNGKPATPEEMPPTWHRWLEIARNHRAEAKRLKAYLRSPAPLAAE